MTRKEAVIQLVLLGYTQSNKHVTWQGAGSFFNGKYKINIYSVKDGLCVAEVFVKEGLMYPFIDAFNSYDELFDYMENMDEGQ